MAYMYETHLHTSTSSACGKAKGSEYVEKYIECGYDGIFVTDHFYLGNTCVPCDLQWEEWVKRYAEAYYETAERGEELGLKVFFGWETSYGSGEDFLIYGLGPEWLVSHPEIITLDQVEQYSLVHSEGGAVVQAHPFRERWYMNEIRLHPWHCDAWETINGGNTPYQDANAIKYSGIFKKNVVCGSDIHSLDAFDEGKVVPLLTEVPLSSAVDYARLLLRGTGWSITIPDDRLKIGEQAPELEVFLHDEHGHGSRMHF